MPNDKKSYTMAHVSIAYAPFGGGAFDCKTGISEDGVSIAMAEDYGERTVGADGSTFWSEYCSNNGTITLNVLANSPAYAFFATLQSTQRVSGTKGRDTMTIVNKDFSESFSCKDVAIQSIGEVTYDKVGNAARVITFNAGDIQRTAA